MTYSNLGIVFVTSWFWLFICAMVACFSYTNGLDHADDHINWSTGFSKGWKKGWNSGVEIILECAEKHGLAAARKAFENLKKQEENPPE